MRSTAGEPVRQVLVIGGSLTGLFTAAALVGDGREVTIVERDEFPREPVPRPGVPQSAQAHIFLHRGLLAAEELLPGIRADLLAAGSLPIDGGHLVWLSKEGWLPTYDGFELLSSTRPLLEHVVRRQVIDLPGMTVRTGSRVSGLARAGPGWTVHLEDGASLEAELVVDASGRTSRLVHWLADLGTTVPEPDRVDAQVGYATRLYRARETMPADMVGLVIAATPESLQGGLALPVEDGQWLVLAIGCADRRPARDNEAFERFFGALSDPSLDDLLTHLEPVGDAQIYRQTSNTRHPYERVRDWPAGLLAVGDALCAFNPVYGQGITVGAIQAALLRRAAQRGLRAADTPRLQRQVGAEVATPWSIATSTDLSYPTSAGSQSRFQTWLAAWTDELGRMSVHGDRRANETLVGVYNLVLPPRRLFHPALVAAAVRAWIRGYGATNPRPEVLNRLVTGRESDGSASAISRA